MKKFLCIGALQLGTLVISSDVLAAKTFYLATLQKLVTDTATGTCAAWVAPGPQDNSYRSLPDCNNRWVSFDCAGDFASKSYGNTAFNTAQLAFVTGRQVQIEVTDGQRLDVGSTQYCKVLQVQVAQ